MFFFFFLPVWCQLYILEFASRPAAFSVRLSTYTRTHTQQKEEHAQQSTMRHLLFFFFSYSAFPVKKVKVNDSFSTSAYVAEHISFFFSYDVSFNAIVVNAYARAGRRSDRREGREKKKRALVWQADYQLVPFPFPFFSSPNLHCFLFSRPPATLCEKVISFFF